MPLARATSQAFHCRVASVGGRVDDHHRISTPRDTKDAPNFGPHAIVPLCGPSQAFLLLCFESVYIMLQVRIPYCPVLLHCLI